MVHSKDATVWDVFSWNGDISHCNLTFVRGLNNWEADRICSLSLKVSLITIMRLFGHMTLRGFLTVKSFCKHILKL